MKGRNLPVIHSYRVSKHGALIDLAKVEEIARSVMNGIQSNIYTVFLRL